MLRSARSANLLVSSPRSPLILVGRIDIYYGSPPERIAALLCALLHCASHLSSRRGAKVAGRLSDSDLRFARNLLSGFDVTGVHFSLADAGTAGLQRLF